MDRLQLYFRICLIKNGFSNFDLACFQAWILETWILNIGYKLKTCETWIFKYELYKHKFSNQTWILKA